MSGETITATYTSGQVLTSLDSNPVVFTPSATITSTGSTALGANVAYDWTIQNSGLLQVVSGTAGSAGIALGTASVTNTTVGTIAGYTAGVDVSGTGTVLNQGTISASQTAGSAYHYNPADKSSTVLSAAVMLGSGVVTNASGGLISSGLGGVGIQGAGSVANYGSIVGTQLGVVLASGGGVSNASTGTISGLQYAIFSGGTTALTLTNQGQISSAANYAVEGASGGIVSNASGGTISAARVAIALYSGNASTITNSGQITGGATNSAVFLSGTASVTNASSGTIAGGHYALDAGTASSISIVNAGVMNGTTVAGILLTHGGSVTNTPTGSIYSRDRYAFYGLNAAPVSLTNQGLMFGYAYTAVVLTSGVVSNAAGGQILGSTNAIGGHIYRSTANPASFFTVSNAGTIIGYGKDGVFLQTGGVVSNASGGTIAGAKYAVYAAGTQTSTLTNAGQLIGTATAGFILLDGGAVTNASGGTITGGIAGGAGFGTTAISIDNMSGGSITAPSYGLLIGSANAQVTNAGSIWDTQTLAGAGLDERGGGSVTNTTSGHITSKWIGVQIGARTTAVGGTLVNAGSIFASDGVNGAAVWIHGPGYISNSASGTINGGPYAIVAYYATTLVNAGSIGGTTWAFDPVNAGFVQQVTVDPGAKFTGTVSGGNTIGGTAVSTLALAAGTAAGTLGGIGTQFIEFGQVTVATGAAWTLTGANTIVPGAALTDSGTVFNTGSLTGGITLNGGIVTNVSGATITGTFTAVYGPSASAGGTVVNAGLLAGAPSGFSAGIALFSGGTVTNTSTGTITGPEGLYITASSTAVNTGSVLNFGLIVGTQHQGVEVADGGNVTNALGGTISGAYNGVAVSIVSTASQSATVFNQGIIVGTTSYGVALRSAGVDILTNAATGVITGGQGGVYVADGTVVNAGSIGVSGTGTAALAFGAGAGDRLVLDPGASFTGTVSGGNIIGSTIVSALELASGASTGTLSGFGTKYVEFARVGVDVGATWVLSGTQTIANGITLTDSGTLTNTSSLADYGYLNAKGLLTNSAAVAGMVHLSGGTIVNVVNATIAGNPASIYEASGSSAGTVLNAGLLQGGTTSNHTGGVALFTGGLISNAATGTIQGGGAGVYIGNQAVTTSNGGTLLNQGTIAATGTHANGAELGDGGLISNAAGGVITGSNHGVQFDTTSTAQSSTVLNQGRIAGGTTSQTGVYLASGGVVSNTGTGSIYGAQQGVYFNNSGASGGTLTNTGSIGAGTAGTDVAVGFARAGTVINAGTIGASGAAGYAIRFATGFTNSLILDPGAVFNGTVSGGNQIGFNPVSQMELASGASAGTLTGLGTQFLDFGQVTVDPNATWVAAGANTVVSGSYLTDTGTFTDTGALTNAGIIGGGTALGLSGGTIINALHATIAGSFVALYGPSGASAGTVLNAGVLVGGANPTRSAAIGMFSTGYISNAATGTITGGALGIYLAGSASVVNAGLILGQSTQSGGIQLGGGQLINAATGTIAGVHRGIEMTLAGLVVNQGLITASSTNGYGLYLQAGGTVINTGVVNAAVRGVYFGSSGTSAGTLTNAGTIVGTAADAASFASGFANRLILDPGAVFTGTVDGGNTIGAGHTSTLELASGASAGTLSSFGSKYIDFARIVIDSGATWVFSGNDSIAHGVTLTNNGTLSVVGVLTNSAVLAGPISVASGGQFINNSGGTIVGSGLAAVRGSSGGPGTVFNAGLIDPATYGVYLPDGGVVTNVGGGTIVGTEAGVQIQGAVGTVLNTGSIAGTGGGSYGVRMTAGGTAVNNAGGTITGVAYGVRIVGGSATVTNAGSISGGSAAVAFGAGTTNRLILKPGESMSGQVDGGNLIGGGAVSTLELASGSSTGKITGFGSTIVNFAQVTVDSAAGWVLAGTDQLASGVTLTNAGTVYANGTVVDDGLIASGSGTVLVGSSAANNGTIFVNAGGTFDVGSAGTNPGLILGNGPVSGTLAASTGTVLVTGAGAALNAYAPVLIGKAVGSSGLLTIAQGATGQAVTSNETLQAAVGIGPSGQGELVVTDPGSVFTAQGQIAVGRAGTGILLVENQGTLVLAPDSLSNAPEMDIGVGSSTNQAQSGGVGNATVTGGGIINAGSTTSLIRIGGGGDQGTLTVNGGSILVGTLKLGSTTTISGTTATGAGFLNIGTGGWVDVAATATATASVVIGQNQGSSGTVTVNAGTLISGGAIVLGNQTLTNGLLTVGTSAVVTSVGLIAAAAAGSTGTVIVNDGTLTNSGYFHVGLAGSGVMTIEAGGLVTSTQSVGPTVDIGVNTGAQGTVVVTGSLSALTVNGQFVIGDQAFGSLDVNTSGLVNAGTNFVDLGNQNGGTGVASVESGGTLIGGSLNIANVFTGTASGLLTVGAGGSVAVSALSVGGGGTVIVTGTSAAVLSDSGFINLGQSGTTAALLSIGPNGTVTFGSGSGSMLIAPSSGENGTVTVNGGTLSGTGLNVAAELSGTATALMNVGAGGVVDLTNLSEGAGGTILVGGTAAADVTVTGVTSIGQFGTGATMTENANGYLFDQGGLDVGTQTGSSGTVVVNGGSIGGGVFQVGGDGGSGTLLVENSGQVTAYSTTLGASVGAGTGGDGTLTINGGSLAVTTPLFTVGGTNSIAQLLIENSGQLLTSLANGFGFAGEGDIDATGTGLASAAITSGGTWTVSTGNVIVGKFGYGSLDINNNGVLNLGTSVILTVGQQSTSNGTLTIENGGSLLGGALATANGATASAQVIVGAGGFVSVNSVNQQAGGTITIGGTTAAVVDVSGGIYVGSEDAGTGVAYMTIDAGGTVVDSGSGFTSFNVVQVGQGAGTTGTLTVNGGTLIDAGALNVDKGLVTIYGGGLVTVGTASAVQVGQFTAGTVMVNGGTLTGADALVVSNGLLDVYGGGVVNVSGGSLVQSSVGSSGSGTLIVNGGTLSQTDGGLTFGPGLGGGPVGVGGPGGANSGVLLVDNGGTLTTTDTNGIAFDTGSGTVTGATWTVNGALAIGNASGTASLDVNTNGLVNASGNYVSVGLTGGTGTLTVESGGTVIGGLLTVSDNASGSTGLVAIGGSGTVEATGVSVGGGGTITLGGTGQTALLTETGGFGVGSGGNTSAELIVNQFGSVSDTGSNGFAIGSAGGASGTVVVNDGRLTNSDVLTVGGAGAAGGMLLIEGGGTVIGSYAAGGPAADIDTASTIQAGATVTGSGSLWDLTGAGQQLIVGDTGTGLLSIANGGTVNAGNDTIDIGNQSGGNGSVVVGAGNALLEGGALQVATAAGSAGLLTINVGGTVNVTSAHIGAGGNIVLAGGVLDPPTTITISAGGTISGYGTIDGSLAGGGSVIATGGLLDVTGSVASGSFTVMNGATLELDGSVAAGTTIGFAGTAGVLDLGAGGFSGTLNGFLQGDSLILSGVTDVSSVTISPPGTLDIKQTSGPDIFVPLDSTFDYADGTFSFFTAGGVTTITDNVTPCYLAGTLIRTDRGDVRVEDLAIGDCVITLKGAAEPIKWIGRRAYSSAFAAGNRDIIPILIKQGALADNVPARDLYVSPLHAMYLDNVLVQAEHLVNGTTIVRCPHIDPIRYFHIELDRHDVIFAEGAPAETFVDCDSRGMFHNAPEFAALYPDAQPARWKFCAARIDSGPVLERIQQGIAARAGAILETSGGLRGNLDGLDGNTITGWAFDPEHPDTAIALEVLDGDGLIARVVANRFRSDLEAAGIGDGHHGFELPLSRALSPLTHHALRVRRVGDTRELAGSPLLIEPSDRKSLLKEVRQAVDGAAMATDGPEDLDALLATFLNGIDLVRRLRATQSAHNDGDERLLHWARGPRQQPKRALIVDTKLPRRDRSSGSAAVLSHVAALRALGWEVEVVASDELARGEDAIHALKAWGVTCHRAPLVSSVEEVLRRKRAMFDLVYLHRLPNAEAYAALARAWQPSARLVYSAATLAGGSLKAREITAMRMVDATIVQTAADAAYLRREASGARVHVISQALTATPRGVPKGEYQGLAFIGEAGDAADAEALGWLTSEVMPLVWARHADMPLLLAGGGWTQSGLDQRIHVVGPVDRLESVLAAVRLTVAPRRSGIGVHNAVLESLAAGVPCAMTPVSAEGIPLTGALLDAVTPNAEAMAALILDLHDKAALNGRHAREGLALVKAHYSEAVVTVAMRSAVGEGVPRAALSRAG